MQCKMRTLFLDTIACSAYKFVQIWNTLYENFIIHLGLIYDATLDSCILVNSCLLMQTRTFVHVSTVFPYIISAETSFFGLKIRKLFKGGNCPREESSFFLPVPFWIVSYPHLFIRYLGARIDCFVDYICNCTCLLVLLFGLYGLHFGLPTIWYKKFFCLYFYLL